MRVEVEVATRGLLVQGIMVYYEERFFHYKVETSLEVLRRRVVI